MRSDSLSNDLDGADPDAAQARTAGRRIGEWWAKRKARRAELERVAAWAAGVARAGVDPFDPDLPLGPPYSPAEQVYFALAGEAGYGDRSAARWFWNVNGAHEYLGGWAEPEYMHGFVDGAMAVGMAASESLIGFLGEVMHHE